MRSKLVWSGAITAGLIVTGAGLAAQAKPGTAAEKSVIVSVVGCVERETDYRKRTADSRAGRGVGTGNEFVLTFAKSVSTVGVHTDKTHTPTGTSGLEEVYRITGNLEDELKREIGRHVEVTGYVEVDESNGTAHIRDLPRMNVGQWHRVGDFCPRPGK